MSNPLPVTTRKESTSTGNENQQGCRMIQNIVILTHGLEYWVEQMRLMLKLMG